MDRRGDRAPAATEDAERAGAIVAEQIRAITEAVEHRAGEVRHDAEAAAGTIEEEGRDAARRVFDRIDRIETAMQHAIRSLRQEADALSRLVGRGPPVRGESPSASTPGSGTLALEPGTDPVEGGSFAGAPAREADLEPASVEATELDAEGAGEPPIVDPESEALPAEAPPASEIAPPLEPESLALEPEESLPADEPLPLEPEESLPPEEPLPIEPDEASAEAPETPAVSEAGGISTIEPEAGEPVPVDGEESLPPAALEPEIVAEGRDDPFEPGESEDVPPDLAEPPLAGEELGELGLEPPLEPEEPGPLEPSGREEPGPLEPSGAIEPEPFVTSVGPTGEEEEPEIVEAEPLPAEVVFEPPLTEEELGEPPGPSAPLEEPGLSTAHADFEHEVDAGPEELGPPLEIEGDLKSELEGHEAGEEQLYPEPDGDLAVDDGDAGLSDEDPPEVEELEPAKPGRLRSLFRRRSSPTPDPPTDEGAEGDLSEDPLVSDAEEPVAFQDDEPLDSPPLVVQEGWWEQKPEDEDISIVAPRGDEEEPLGEDVGPPEGAAGHPDTDVPAAEHPHDALSAGVEPEEESLPEEEVDSAPPSVEGGAVPGAVPEPHESAESYHCNVCRRAFEGAAKAADTEGWHIAGGQALCDRCQAAGWRLHDEPAPPRRGGGR